MGYSTESDEEKEMGTVTSADGTEISYERSGSGPPLVLVHGAIFDRAIWEIGDVRSKFAEHTTVYAMDRRNHGDSGSADDFSLEAQFADVVTVVESIDGPVDLLAHSAGASIALGAAPRIDNLRSVILHEPPGPSDEYVADIEEPVAEMMGLLDEGQYEQALVLFLDDVVHFESDELDEIRSSPIWDAHVERFPQTLLPLQEALRDYEWDFTLFEDLSTPTLLPVGSESGHFKDMNDVLHDTLPNSRVATFEGHGHGAHLVASDRYTDEILSFISEVD